MKKKALHDQFITKCKSNLNKMGRNPMDWWLLTLEQVGGVHTSRMTKFQLNFGKKRSQQWRRVGVAVGLEKKGGVRKKGLGFYIVQAYHHRFVTPTGGDGPHHRWLVAETGSDGW
jgi:hypothetical protein